MSYFAFLLGADPSLADIGAKQNTLMRCFVQEIPAEFFDDTVGNDIIEGCDHRDGAQRFEVQLQDGLVDLININSVRLGNFLVDFVPQSVRTLKITSSNQKYRLRTRRLPRAAARISFYQNELFGHLDLRTLPPRIEECNFAENRLTGPIELIDIPATLRRLSIRQNKIKQPFLFYGELPKNLWIYMAGNRVGSVEPFEASGAEERNDVFVDMKNKRSAFDAETEGYL